MIVSRIYEPTDDEIIFHYCDANTFHSICTNKTLRLSDLFSMNDFLEIHWGYSIWEKAATEIIKEVGREFLDKIDEVIHSFGLKGLITAACFSKNGDVLSQWRAYADNGKGYAIGFKAKDILQLPVRPLKVLYDEVEQIAELKKIILEINEAEKLRGDKFERDFQESCGSIPFDLAAFKNPAFQEEQEIRIIHVLSFIKSNSFLKLVDTGGTAFGKKVDGRPIKFRMSDNIPVAFIEEDFSNEGKLNPIVEVIIGPKNDVLLTAISVFLETIGLSSVKIKKSKASYR